MIITGISFNDQKNLFELSLDDKNTIFVDYNLYTELNLHRNKELTEEEFTLLKDFENNKKLTNIAINFINYRIRSEKEIKDRLLKENASLDEIENIIVYLKDNKFIDDEYFAKTFFDNKSRINRWSSRKIKYELKQKGISSNLIDEIIFDAYEVDYDNAHYLVSKKIDNWKDKFQDFKLKNKIYTFLSQRGFDYEIISSITEEFI